MTNREIDALVHQHAMGNQPLAADMIRRGYTQTVPRYSTDPAASDQLLDRMAELGWMSILISAAADQHTCVFHRDEPKGSMGFAQSDTRQGSISLTALRALGVEVPA